MPDAAFIGAREGKKYPNVSETAFKPLISLHSMESSWFALKIFKGMVQAKRDFADAGIRTFVPYVEVPASQEGGRPRRKPLMASLIFVRTTPKYVKEYWVTHLPGVSYYRDLESSEPAVIPDVEMEVFIKLTSPADAGARLFENDGPQFHKGQEVRITEGRFKGYAGHIFRIGKDRKVVVKVTDHFSFLLDIHPRFLEPVI